MTFGEYFAHHLDPSDVGRLIYVIRRKLGMSLPEIIEYSGARIDRDYQYIWEIEGYFHEEHIVKLLDLLYHEKPKIAREFMIDLFTQLIDIIRHDEKPEYLGCP